MAVRGAVPFVEIPPTGGKRVPEWSGAFGRRLPVTA
jgi:hypothetical protein